MEPLHVMLPEDEIFLCGMVLLYGVIVGAAVRLVMYYKERKAT